MYSRSLSNYLRKFLYQIDVGKDQMSFPQTLHDSVICQRSLEFSLVGEGLAITLLYRDFYYHTIHCSSTSSKDPTILGALLTNCASSAFFHRNKRSDLNHKQQQNWLPERGNEQNIEFPRNSKYLVVSVR